MNAAAIAALVRIAEWVAGRLARRKAVRTTVLPLVQKADEITASTDVATHEARRKFVVGLLVQQGLSETDAYLLTHAALKLWKRLKAKAAARAARRARRQQVV